MPLDEIGKAVSKKYGMVKEWGQGLSKMYKKSKSDSKPMREQISDMFNPKKSVFAEAVANKFRKTNANGKR